jgi:hypothetical protein
VGGVIALSHSGALLSLVSTRGAITITKAPKRCFRALAGKDKSVLRYFVQLALLYPAILIASIPFDPLLRMLGLSGQYAGGVNFVGYEAILCLLLVGPLVGWAAGRISPELISTGRWVWMLPVVSFLSGIVPSFLQGQLAMDAPYLPEDIFATGSNEGLAALFFTLPAFAATGYSLGALLAGRWLQWRAVPMQRVKRFAVVGITFLAALVLLLAGTHRIVRTRIRKWHEVRSVPPRAMVAVSRDADVLCGDDGATSGNAGTGSLVYPNLARSLELRVCNGQHMRDSRTAPQNDGHGLKLEKILVLTGPHQGETGWVRAGELAEEGSAQ